MKNSRQITFFPLLLLITLHLIILAYWLKRDHSFLINDGFDHYIVSLLKHSNIKNFFSDTLIQTQNITPFIKWHGTFHASLCGFFLLFIPITQDNAVFINALIFFPAAVIFTYLIAKCFFDKHSALLAAIIFSFSPIINQHTRIFMSDLPLTTLICGSIYFLIKTHRQNTLYNSIFFIALSMFACFTKINAVLFLAFPCLVFLFYNYKKNINVISILLLIICSLSAVLIKPQIINRIFSCMWVDIYDGELFPGFSDTIIISFFNFMSKSLYELFNFGSTSIVCLLFIIGFIRLRIQKRYNLSLLILLSILIPILTMATLLTIEYDIRYLMPVLPFIAILSGFGLSWIKNKYISKIIILTVLTFLITNYLNLFFSEKNIIKNTPLPLNNQINKLLNRDAFSKALRLNPYEFYKKTPDLHFSQDTLFIFTPKKQNLFRSSLKMNYSEVVPIKYQTINEIYTFITSAQHNSIFFVGENRHLYNLLLEKITKNNISSILIKAENYRQTKNMDLKQQMLQSDYICITPRNDEIFADHKATNNNYQEKINTLLKEKEHLLKNFTKIYQYADLEVLKNNSEQKNS